MKFYAYIAFLVVSITANTYAQQIDTTHYQLLQDVVVTGQYEPQSAQKSVYTVRTILADRIIQHGATRLQDVLNTELNIRFMQDLTLGGSNLSLQGLPGQNVKILIDGVPMIGRQGTTNEININQINVNSIDRIEIVEGPMSVIFGADALAGVINIITKKAAENKLTLSARLHEESAASEYGINAGIHNQNVSVAHSFKKFYWRAESVRNYFGGWKGIAVDRDKEWNPKIQWLASGLLGWKTERSHLYYRMDYLNETITDPGLYYYNEAIDKDYITHRIMHQMQVEHTFNKKVSYTGALAYTDYRRRTMSTTVHALTGDVRLALGAGMQDATQFSGTTIRGTFQYKINQHISLQPGYDFNLESGFGGRIKQGTQQIGDYAIFISTEWKPFSFLQVRPGLRFMHNSVYQAPFTVPSINIKLILNSKHDLRFSYGNGFRAPSLRELFFDFFDASHSVEGNPNLKAEVSNSFNVSWNWNVPVTNLDYRFSLTGFYNTVDNLINFGQKPSNSIITTYINIDHYQTTGITILNKLKYQQWNFTIGVGSTARRNQISGSKEPELPFRWSPEASTAVGYQFTKIKLSANLFWKYTGRLPYFELPTPENGIPEIHQVEIPDYSWADVTVQKQLGKKFSLTAGVRNLFNISRLFANTSGNAFHSASTEGSQPIGYGRSYFMTATYTFNQ